MIKWIAGYLEKMEMRKKPDEVEGECSRVSGLKEVTE